jgi:hypothetical protein
MTEDGKKVEKKAEQTESEAKEAELSDKDLYNVAGGTSNLNPSKYN